jgi:hypothetical protein
MWQNVGHFEHFNYFSARNGSCFRAILTDDLATFS